MAAPRMGLSMPASETAAPPPPVPEDTSRDSVRSAGRDFVRQRPREPHEKYAVAKLPRGMEGFWAALKLRGAPNPRLNEFMRAGWKPARAEDYPDHSGFGIEHDPMLIELGAVKNVGPNTPVILDDMMLMVR